MADINQIFAGSGPLPISVPFQNDNDGPQAVYFTGSAFTANANTLLGFEVDIDGNSYGAAWVYANEANSHKAFVARVFPVDSLSIGSHTLTIRGGADTVTDSNDFFAVDLIA